MSPELFVTKCRQRGVELSVGVLGSLHVYDPGELITDDIINYLTINKSEIIDLLKSESSKLTSKGRHECLPESIYATLDFLRRTDFKKEVTPGLGKWLESEWMDIDECDYQLSEPRNGVGRP